MSKGSEEGKSKRSEGETSKEVGISKASDGERSKGSEGERSKASEAKRPRDSEGERSKGSEGERLSRDSEGERSKGSEGECAENGRSSGSEGEMSHDKINLYRYIHRYIAKTCNVLWPTEWPRGVRVHCSDGIRMHFQTKICTLSVIVTYGVGRDVNSMICIQPHALTALVLRSRDVKGGGGI